jgi:hypothetical protein
MGAAAANASQPVPITNAEERSLRRGTRLGHLSQRPGLDSAGLTQRLNATSGLRWLAAACSVELFAATSPAGCWWARMRCADGGPDAPGHVLRLYTGCAGHSLTWRAGVAIKPTTRTRNGGSGRPDGSAIGCRRDSTAEATRYNAQPNSQLNAPSRQMQADCG